jgi:RNA polymerase sigma-70 factor (ECF subfamily)
LANECEAEGKGQLFCAVKPLLSGERNGATCASVGQQLGMTEGALRVAVHRLRQRYGALLRGQIAETVSNPQEVDEEMRDLLKALSSASQF